MPTISATVTLDGTSEATFLGQTYSTPNEGFVFQTDSSAGLANGRWNALPSAENYLSTSSLISHDPLSALGLVIPLGGAGDDGTAALSSTAQDAPVTASDELFQSQDTGILHGDTGNNQARGDGMLSALGWPGTPVCDEAALDALWGQEGRTKDARRQGDGPTRELVFDGGTIGRDLAVDAFFVLLATGSVLTRATEETREELNDGKERQDRHPSQS